MKESIKSKILVSLLASIFLSQSALAEHGEVFFPDGKGGLVDSNGKSYQAGTGDGKVGGSGGGWGPSGSGTGSGGPKGAGPKGESYSGGVTHDFYSSEGHFHGGNNGDGVKDPRSREEIDRDNENIYLQSRAEKLVSTIKDSIEKNDNTLRSIEGAVQNATTDIRKSEELFNGNDEESIDVVTSLDAVLKPQLRGNIEFLRSAGTLGTEPASASDFKSPAGDFRDKLTSLKTKLLDAHPANPQGQFAKDAGLVAVDEADASYAAGRKAQAAGFYNAGVAFLDIALGFIPVVGFAKSLYEAISGKRLLTGGRLSQGARVIALVAAATLGYGDFLNEGANILNILGAKAVSEDAAAIEEMTSEATKIVSNVRNIKIENGTTLNREAAVRGATEAPYVEDATVLSGELKTKPTFFRVHEEGFQDRAFVVPENPLALGKTKFLDRYAKPHTDPTAILQVSRVEPPAGTSVEISAAGPNKWGNGGGIQIKLLDTPQKDWFTLIGTF